MRFSRQVAAVATAAALVGAASAVPAQPADPVVATVNGAQILRSDVEAARLQLPEQYQELPMERLFEPLVDQLIRSRLLSQKARDEKLQDTEGHRRRLAMVEDRMLEEAYLRREIEEKVTEDSLRARYRDSIASFDAVEEVRARHILVKTEEEAAAIIGEIAGGADFATLASEKSIGPSNARGGDLDYFGRGQMVKPFEDAAFALGKGEVTQKPVQSPFGWHVIKLEDKRQSKPPSFEEAQGRLAQEMSQEIAEEAVQKLSEGAAIQRFEIDGGAQRLKRVE
ncbi:MAG: peptidylprolyl isomerase [Rhodospirillaceae bacterium]